MVPAEMSISNFPKWNLFNHACWSNCFVFLNTNGAVTYRKVTLKSTSGFDVTIRETFKFFSILTVMVLCKKTSDYYCADVKSLYRVVSVVHHSSLVLASDCIIINVFANISFVSFNEVLCDSNALSSLPLYSQTQQLHKLLENGLSMSLYAPGYTRLNPTGIRFVMLCGEAETAGPQEQGKAEWGLESPLGTQIWICSLHWSPLVAWIFKSLVLAYHAVNGSGLSYIQNMVKPYTQACANWLILTVCGTQQVIYTCCVPDWNPTCFACTLA